MSDTEYYESKMREAREDLAKARKAENDRKAAEELWSIYSAYITAGFSEEQAFTMLMALVNKAISDSI